MSYLSGHTYTTKQVFKRPSNPRQFLCVEIQKSSKKARDMHQDRELIEVSNAPLCDEALERRVQELDDLNEHSKETLKNEMRDTTSLLEEMRVQHIGMANRPEPISYFITLWEISELESQIEYKKTFRVQGKLEIFRDKNSGTGKQYKQKYIYAGRDGEAFWFTTSKQKVKKGDKKAK